MKMRSVSRRGVVLVTVAAVAAAVAVAAWRTDLWSSSAATGRAAQTQSGAAATAGLTSYAIGARPRVPDLRGQTLDGDRLALADLRGHVLVINVWGSWCQPCRKEAPDLVRVARETAPSGVRFVGIDTRDNLAAARAFARSFNVPYPSLVDTDGRLLLAFSGVIPVSAVPSTLVIDAEGNITARVVGIVSYATLRGLVDDVLAEASPRPSGVGKGGS
ncbi:TlpA family protein disulfide reductase [Actinokineospora sp.]|uniref:TlpA family protein disulfide reductase n=1 Tax=Actinokineospora sp. TaxID=1872133 RepID=UPI003D6B996C